MDKLCKSIDVMAISKDTTAPKLMELLFKSEHNRYAKKGERI